MNQTVLISPETSIPRNPGETIIWGRVYGNSAALAIAELSILQNRPLLVLAPSVAEAEALEHELHFFLADHSDVVLFPDLEVLPYDSFSPHQDLISRRLNMLRQLSQGQVKILLAAVSSTLPRLPPLSFLDAHGIKLAVGQSLAPNELAVRIENAGYQRVSQVREHGDYAVRGSLIDLFPMGHDLPVRVDFFDDEIESIRTFEPESQTSSGASAEQLESLDSFPAREVPIDPDAIKYFRLNYRRRFDGNPAHSIIYSEISEGRVPGGAGNYLPLFFESTPTFWDYLGEDVLTISIGDHASLANLAWDHVQERYEQSCHDTERPALSPEELYCTVDEHHQQIAKRPVIQFETREIPEEQVNSQRINLPISAAPPLIINRRDSDPARSLKQFLSRHSGQTVFAAESTGRREMLSDILREQKIHPVSASGWQQALSTDGSSITIAALSKGFILNNTGTAVFSEYELFGKAQPRRRRRRVKDPEALINDLTNLHTGAPVVHSDHGVGRYTGLTTLNIEEINTEFVTLEYAGGDLLHVPVSSLHLISRYTGASPEHAPLHRLGSDQWARVQRKAAEKARDVAAELLELYSKRAARQGHSCHYDPAEYAAFADGFPFTLTDDQSSAIDQVLDDLTNSRPMDRLICGDVGFGKTEVALRAAFVSVSSGGQVAILVPTTLLAQQHFQTFRDRFSEWPVKVELLSRFRSQRETRQVIDGLASGTVDIVIGTHRLLQRGTRFKNLNLAIIDEEHRFGVRHKEKLKSLRTEVDILTLTATPIPRTLNMALGSLRELSLIATPPDSRLAIKTFVTQWEASIIREACLREIKRGGQIYFVHNRVQDIEKIAAQLADILPEGKIEIAHGQMREHELERIMQDFYHRRFHILLCTSIIESGLDVPSANTIIINRADRFGLAQLHQLRGRVGRSHHQAFAYLLAPRKEEMTADAISRLEAVESLEDLGAGFVLATHDLEIRGAGELLGEGQTGQITEIGFSLYNEMLTKTIQAMREGTELDLESATQHGPEINLHLPALMPEDYLPDVHLRLVQYKRIASAKSARELESLQVEMIDRFGLLPDATRNLFRVTALRIAAEPSGIQRVDASYSGGFIEFGPKPAIDPGKLVQLLESEPERYSLDRLQRLRFREDLADYEQRFEFVEQLLARLAS